MKIVSFSVATPIGRMDRLGAIIDEDGPFRIVDLNSAYADYLARETNETKPLEAARLRVPPDMIGWLEGGARSRDAAAQALAYVKPAGEEGAVGFNGATLVFGREDVRLLSPLPRPRSFRDFSSYEEHMSKNETDYIAKTKPASWYTYPNYYKGNADAFAGPEDPILFPYYAKQLDPEFEIGIIVGREGRNLTVEAARDYIAGYTILVDSSARSGSYPRESFGPGKSKDFHFALGPCMVTADAIDPADIDVRLLVDGEVWYQGNTGHRRAWRPEQLVAFASDSETLHPGDLLGTGTIGASCSMDTHRWPQVGQTMTFEAAGIGAMSLAIVAGERVVGHVDGMKSLLTPPQA